IVNQGNSNGNAGRPYYLCDHCHRWITWGDNRGISGGNPLCFCGAISRQDRAGNETSIPRLGFWTCATGSCDY
ncbi:uncharacterized protein K460DRAFT_268311, partial [Cucurbitaria berberidis CBS 394.84]